MASIALSFTAAKGGEGNAQLAQAGGEPLQASERRVNAQRPRYTNRNVSDPAHSQGSAASLSLSLKIIRKSTPDCPLTRFSRVIGIKSLTLLPRPPLFFKLRQNSVPVGFLDGLEQRHLSKIVVAPHPTAAGRQEVCLHETRPRRQQIELMLRWHEHGAWFDRLQPGLERNVQSLSLELDLFQQVAGTLLISSGLLNVAQCDA
ncbi:MAG TPA: hypothetical protein VFB00_03970 [Terriglobales bacterium]|nr:hypothetical protein [Terriglobales bacterium]